MATPSEAARLVGERKITLNDAKPLREDTSSTGPPRRQRSRGQVANSRLDPESIYPGTAGAIPETGNQKDNAIEDPSCQINASKTRPTRAWKAKQPVATTWAAHPDPMVTPMVQNVLPHHDPMVQNVHSHLAVRQAGRNLPNEPPIGSIIKRLDDMLSTPFCSHIIHYEPPRGFLVPKFSTYDGSSDPFDRIMHY
ncbi:hypothetical protein CK203_037579 [Vitis vinifera]|uniref:Uncharacterized protein n=1 Tax=Vitis vinifera TaxID=29760 RepID=A0A438HMH5_VITVI|nr:hypothetical protein CK203_037579 [Vitis vinifera]